MKWIRRALVFASALVLTPITAANALAQSPPTNTFTQSTTEQVIFKSAQVSTSSSITSWRTQIIGELQGGYVVYDQTFNAPYSDIAVQAGQADAIAAITTEGGPGVVIGTPILTATSQTVTSSTTTTTYSLNSTANTVTNELTFGPDTIQIGQRTVCSGTSSLPSTTAPSCTVGTPTTYVLQDGETNINTNTDTAYTIDQSTLIAQSLELFEQYTITGIVQAVGGEHAAVISAIGEENTRFTRRLLAEIVAGRRNGGGLADFAQADKSGTGMGWVNGFAWTGEGDADDRSAAGLDGGLSVDVSDEVRLGFGVSHGKIDSAADDGGDADATLTEVGVGAAWRSSGFYAGVAGVAGFGSVESSSYAAKADYDTSLFSAAVEAGYDMAVGELTLTPFIGGQWVWIETDDFTGKGAAALSSNGSDSDFGEGWIGLMASGTINRVTLSAFARMVAYSDEDIAVPVSFVGSSTRLSINGEDDGGVGADGGVAASLALTDSVSAFADYELRARGGNVIHQGAIGLAANW